MIENYYDVFAYLAIKDDNNNFLYKTFDDVKILSYANIRGFLDAISLRAIDVHRLLMLQDGIEYEEDNIVDRFIDTIQKVYPAVKVITLSREPSWSKYFYQFLLLLKLFLKLKSQLHFPI